MVLELPVPRQRFPGAFGCERRPSEIVRRAKARRKQLRKSIGKIEPLAVCGKEVQIDSMRATNATRLFGHNVKKQVSSGKRPPLGRKRGEDRTRDLKAKIGHQAARVDYVLDDVPSWVRGRYNVNVVQTLKTGSGTLKYEYPSGYQQLIKSDIPHMIPVYSDNAAQQLSGENVCTFRASPALRREKLQETIRKTLSETITYGLPAPPGSAPLPSNHVMIGNLCSERPKSANPNLQPHLQVGTTEAGVTWKPSAIPQSSLDQESFFELEEPARAAPRKVRTSNQVQQLNKQNSCMNTYKEPKKGFSKKMPSYQFVSIATQLSHSSSSSMQRKPECGPRSISIVRRIQSAKSETCLGRKNPSQLERPATAHDLQRGFQQQCEEVLLERVEYGLKSFVESTLGSVS